MVGDAAGYPGRTAAVRAILHRTPPILALDWTLLLDHTVRTRFGNAWALRILLLLLLALLLVWSKREAERTPRSAWLAVTGSAAGLAVTPALSGHAAAGPDAAVGAVVGVVHFSAAAVWFGGLVLLGTCLLPRAEGGLLGAVARFSSVAFTAMVVIVVTGMVQGWRQVGASRPWGTPPMGACWWPRWRRSCSSSWSPAAAVCWSGAS